MSPSPDNPFTNCGIGGNTASLSLTGYSCPNPPPDCDPNDASSMNQLQCSDYCADLQLSAPGGLGCCVIKASCDGGPCAPVACCGFQDCIPLLS